MVECTGFENRHTPKGYQRFKSSRLRKLKFGGFERKMVRNEVSYLLRKVHENRKVFVRAKRLQIAKRLSPPPILTFLLKNVIV